MKKIICEISMILNKCSAICGECIHHEEQEERRECKEYKLEENQK